MPGWAAGSARLGLAAAEPARAVGVLGCEGPAGGSPHTAHTCCGVRPHASSTSRPPRPRPHPLLLLPPCCPAQVPIRTLVVNQVLQPGLREQYLATRRADQQRALQRLRDDPQLAQLQLIEAPLFDLEVSLGGLERHHCICIVSLERRHCICIVYCICCRRRVHLLPGLALRCLACQLGGLAQQGLVPELAACRCAAAAQPAPLPCHHMPAGCMPAPGAGAGRAGADLFRTAGVEVRRHLRLPCGHCRRRLGTPRGRVMGPCNGAPNNCLNLNCGRRHKPLPVSAASRSAAAAGPRHFPAPAGDFYVWF